MRLCQRSYATRPPRSSLGLRTADSWTLAQTEDCTTSVETGTVGQIRVSVWCRWLRFTAPSPGPPSHPLGLRRRDQPSRPGVVVLVPPPRRGPRTRLRDLLPPRPPTHPLPQTQTGAARTGCRIFRSRPQRLNPHIDSGHASSRFHRVSRRRSRAPGAVLGGRTWI